MSKKPQPRSLSAEPLEERHPVSSSAAGVLLGFGLANDTTTAAYEAPQTAPAPVAQQPTLVDLTLDLQLDALAVDLVHSEESLLDTISSASADPFVLTPLTSGVALSDTGVDTHRELGDELLLFQISTLDFGRVDSGAPLRTEGGAAFHGESFWSDVSRLDTKTWRDTKEYVARESGVIVPLEQAVKDYDHECYDDNGPMTPRSGGGDFVVAKFYWDTFSGGATLAGNSGGGSSAISVPEGGIFADKDSPGQQGDGYKQFRIYVTASNSTTESETIIITAHDVYNWALPNGGTIITSPDLPDNNGSLTFSDTTITFKAGESGTQYVTVTVTDAHAGDNWRFRAKFSSGGGHFQYRFTETFTVWKRLNVELDSMGPSVGIPACVGSCPDIGHPQIDHDHPMDVPLPDTTLLEQELKKVCIVVKPYEDNAVVELPFVSLMRDDYQVVTPQGISGEYHKGITQAGPIRSIPESTKDYWTIHVITAYEMAGGEHDNEHTMQVAPLSYSGCKYSVGENKGTAYVFYECIRDMVLSHGSCPGFPFQMTPMATLFRRVVAHEVLHSFIGEHNSPNSTLTDSNIMNGGQQMMNAKYDYTLNLVQKKKIQSMPYPMPASEQ